MQARATFSMQEYTELMQNVFTTSVNKDTIDECPLAYKPIAEIIANIGAAAEVIEQVVPIYNFKAAE